jgi:plasmid stabilization system protein ParE
MRRVRLSRTFNEQLADLLDQGEQLFGERIANEKRAILFSLLRNQLAHFPAAKPKHPTLGLVTYPVSRTPFVVLYDFDDVEVRVHFVVHRRASLDDLDPGDVEW